MNQDSLATEVKGEFKIMPVVVTVLLLLLGIATWANWYSANVSMPRYCEDPQQTVHYLEKVINEKRPAGDEARRPYLIAAKLLYLMPRHSQESVEEYLSRVGETIRRECR